MRPSPVVRRRVGAGVLAAAALALVWLLLAGGGEPEDPPPITGAPESATTAAGGDTGSPSAAQEDLIDGVMLVGFEGSDPAQVASELGDHDYGGVLVATSNWPGVGPGARLIEELRKESEALIATVQEGGTYRSLPDLPPAEREIEIGDRGKPALAEEWGEETAKALADAGFDLNLAPVADVATLDSPIADRAFSDDPDVAAEMTEAAVQGCEAGGIACAVAHFPGLGAASQDTDAGPASVGLDPATLASRDLIPFQAAFEAGAPAVVVSHGLYIAYDPVSPACLAPEVTTGLLRDQLGFDGVAISDDLGAGAIGAVTDPGSAAVAALNAGIDLVQVADPADVGPVRKALAAALADGTLSEERVEEAAARVARLRRGLG